MDVAVDTASGTIHPGSLESSAIENEGSGPRWPSDLISSLMPPKEGPAMPSDLEALLRETWSDSQATFDETRRWLGCASSLMTLRVNRESLPVEDALKEVAPFLGDAIASKATVHSILKDVIEVQLSERSNVHLEHPIMVVDGPCGAAVLRGSDVFAPGILAISQSAAPRKPSGQCNGAKDHWRALRVGEKVSVVAYFGTAPLTRGTYLDDVPTQLPPRSAVFVGNGTLAMTPAEIFRDGKGIAIANTDGFLESVNMQVIPSSLFAQTLPSAVVAHVLNPQPGENILDACAAPGGKTTHLLTRMKWQGYLLAMDKSKKRTEKLASAVASACHDSERADICEVVYGDVVQSKWRCRHGGAAEMTGFFDRALCDAPCSASGLRPRLSFAGLGKAEVLDYAQYQRRVLKGVVRCVRPGGVVVYSTCSITTQENEEVVRWALDELPLRLLEPSPDLMRLVSPPAGFAATILSQDQCQKVLRFSAAGCNGMGFFIACFERLEESTVTIA